MGILIQDLLGLVVVIALIAAPIILWKRKRRITAVVLGLLVVLLWLAIALPGFKKSHTFAFRATCINNLKVIQRAKAEWATQHNKQGLDVPLETDLVGTNKPLSEMPKCPAGEIITIGPVNQKPTCSLIEEKHAITDEEH